MASAVAGACVPRARVVSPPRAWGSARQPIVVGSNQQPLAPERHRASPLRAFGGHASSSRARQLSQWRASAGETSDEASTDDGDGDDGGSGGSNSGGGGGGGGSDDNPGLGGNIWMLVAVAAAALGLFKVGSKQLKLRTQQSRDRLQRRLLGGDAAADQPSSDEIGALTRLSQEAFSELVRVKERLDELEADAGITTSSAPAGATRVTAGSGGRSRLAVNGAASSSSSSGTGSSGGGSSGHHSRSRLAGVLRTGAGLMWAGEEGAEGEEAAGSALRAAGIKLGTDALLHLAGVVRGGRDSVHAEARLDPAAERLVIRKVLYNCRLSNRLRVVLSPFGARGRDAAYTLNPLAGQGLSSMVRDGSPLHQPVLGSLAAVALEASRAWFSAGYFARGGDAKASSLLAQLVVAPTNDLSAGLTYVEHRSMPAAADGAAAAGAAAAAPNGSAGAAPPPRPTLLGALDRAAGALAGVFADAADSRQLGATLAYRLGQDAVLHGWAAADAGEVERHLRSGQYSEAVRPRDWGLVLGSYPDGSGSGWSLGVGRSEAAAAAAAPGSGSSSGTGGGGSIGGSSELLLPNLFELSLQFNMGEGLLLAPGMLLLTRRGSKEPAAAFLGMRTTWAF